MAVRCVECRTEHGPGPQHVTEFSYCRHPLCVFSQPCMELHVRTCPSVCYSVGQKPEPHPRDLAKQAAEAARPAQLGLFD